MPIISFSLNPQQQAFVSQYIAPLFHNSFLVISFEELEAISDASESVFSFDQWEQLCCDLHWA
ncbi:hypothetical protein [Pleurocapsa sp. PCC 7319]|uniref:hypothetical protein n=1 Tax=Pleurocapsa sp. PCC 7319 TaxID=118161 RepID=UPI0003484287|nr:hypothetical protein [Pleurocapsa sp. PCC 7319]